MMTIQRFRNGCLFCLRDENGRESWVPVHAIARVAPDYESDETCFVVMMDGQEYRVQGTTGEVSMVIWQN